MAERKQDHVKQKESIFREMPSSNSEQENKARGSAKGILSKGVALGTSPTSHVDNNIILESQLGQVRGTDRIGAHAKRDNSDSSAFAQCQDNSSPKQLRWRPVDEVIRANTMGLLDK